MAYVSIPQDLNKVKIKVLFGLTKRQLICFGAAALVGVPLFFLVKEAVNSTTATFCMIFVMLPFFLLAMYEHHGQPLEVYLRQIVETVAVRPKERPYRTKNRFAVMEQRKQLRQEVQAIVQKAEGGNAKAKAHKR